VKKKMKKRLKSSNDGLNRLIDLINKTGRDEQAPFWGDLGMRLSKSRKSRGNINLSRIERFTKADEVVAVPGKLLGAGSINHSVTVAALSFSNGAREKVKKAGGRCVSFEELLRENPRGSNIKIMRGI
jgi:large subunit ribosomal protein L18e